MVEHLKVLSLTVEHACASLTVEHLKVLISRAPKGPLLISRACLRILGGGFSRSPSPYSREFGGLTLIIRPHEEAEVLTGYGTDLYDLKGIL